MPTPPPAAPRRLLGLLAFLAVGGLWHCDFIRPTNHYDDAMTTYPPAAAPLLGNNDLLARQTARPYTVREENGQLVARTRTGVFLAAADLPTSQRRYNAVKADVCRMADQVLAR